MLETGFIVGMVAIAIIALNFILATAVFFIVKNPSDGHVGWFVVSGIVVLVTAVIAGFSLFPYNVKYFQWETKEGIIAKTEFDAKADTSRSSNGGMRIELGDGTTFFTTDYRLAPKRVGERVLLVCKPTFQNGNVDRIDCKSQVGAM